MKTGTIETLLPEFDRLTALRTTTEEMKPRLEQEIEEGLASGELDEKLALSLQTKRAQLELIPAKLAQLDARLAAITEQVKSDFEKRYSAFRSKAGAIQARTKAEIVAALSPFIVQHTDAANQIDNALERYVLGYSVTAHEIGNMMARIDFPVSMGNFIQAARNLLEPERTIEALPIRRKS